jgi:hypothetical protein
MNSARQVCLSFVCFLLAALAAEPARAIRHTEIVVLLGVELESKATVPIEAKLLDADLKLYQTPTMTWTDDKRPKRKFIGLRLDALPLHVSSIESLVMPVPTSGQVRKASNALKKLGLRAEPKLILVVRHWGGKR